MIYSRTLGAKGIVRSEYLDEDIVDLLGTTFQIPDSYNFEVARIDEGYECRPDLMAYEIYNEEMYADDLIKLNGPSNPFEINEDMFMLVPTFDCLNDFMTIPDKRWATKQSRYTPKPKAKTEKRKPNQAVIGDKRFNIDPISKIIIY